MIRTPFILTSVVASLPLLWGCGGDDCFDPPAAGRQIAFESPEAAAHEATTTLTITEFRVRAIDGWNMLMDNVEVHRTGLNSWQYAPAVEWPGTPVDFYAVSPAWIGLKVNPWEKFFEVTDPGAVDVLASTRLGVTQQSGRLKLNFAHAMAQVSVRLFTSRSDVDVSVRQVSMNDIADFGRFHFPSFSTDASASREDVTDCWAIYNSTGPYRMLYDCAEGSILGGEPQEMCSTGIRYFLPIKFAPLVIGDYTHGSHMRIVCRMLDRESGAVVWPDSSTARWHLWADDPTWGVLYVSLADATPGGRWLAGRDYVYTVDVSDTDGSASRSLTKINADGSPVCLVEWM